MSKGSCKRPKISISNKGKNKISKSCFFIDPWVCVPTVLNVPSVAHAQLMEGRLQSFSQKWSLVGTNPREVSILKDGYILPFKLRPPLERKPLIISGYATPQEPLPERGFAGTDTQKGSREGKGSNISSQTKPKVAINLRSQCSQKSFEHKSIQSGNTGNHPDIPPTRGMGDMILVMPICTFKFIQDPINSSGLISKIRHISSGPYLLASLQVLWS